jgi:hypothetical protein
MPGVNLRNVPPQGFFKDHNSPTTARFTTYEG